MGAIGPRFGIAVSRNEWRGADPLRRIIGTAARPDRSGCGIGQFAVTEEGS